MATNGEVSHDPLILLQNSISGGLQPIPTTTSDPSSNTEAVDLADATYLIFNVQSATSDVSRVHLELSTPTRFVSQRTNAPLDLLSVWFCWQSEDTGTSEYLSATQALNEKRSKNGFGSAVSVPFAEKLDLTSWLSGEVPESEYIKSIDDNAATRKAAAGAADMARGGEDVAMGEADGAAGAAKGGRREEERMKEIYASERSMGDRNTVLRGIKPTDFSHVRKHTAAFLRTSRPNGPIPVPTTTSNPALRPASSKSSRRPDPIILLSPSASSLLRLSNIKSFLNDGVFTSPDSSSTGANILYITRTLPSIDPSRELKFILVESPENFKPDYWNRVVAVFTTGQSWQFKGYKWSEPAELFSHALGVYVGWKGEVVPGAVKGWGRGVVSVAVDKWREGQTSQQRWRDREVVEEIWGAVEQGMRARGWGKEQR